MKRRDTGQRVIRKAMLIHKLRTRLGSFSAVIECVRGHILIDALDRACAAHAKRGKRHG